MGTGQSTPMIFMLPMALLGCFKTQWDLWESWEAWETNN